MIENIINGTMKVITANNDDTITPAELRGGVVGASLITLVATAMYTRKRTEEGKEAIIGFLF